MTIRDLSWRLSGAALFLAACGTSLIHKQVIANGAAAAPSALEAGLALASFLLASLGFVLLINGVRLHDAWRKERASGRPDRAQSRVTARRDGEASSRAHFATSDPAAFVAGRELLAALLIHRADRGGASVRARRPAR